MPPVKEDLEPILKGDEVEEENNGSSVSEQHLCTYQKLFNWLRCICGVEVPIFVYFLALGILLPAQQHFTYQRICLYEFDSPALCEMIDSDPAFQTQENTLQKMYSFYSTLHLVFLYTLSTIATVIMGTWCDRCSFRIPLVIPQLGTALGTSMFVFFYFLPSSAIHPALLTLPSIIYGITGASPTIIMTSFAYVSRVTTTGNRTVRVAIVEAAMGLGTTIGYLLSALVLGKANTFLALILQCCCNIYACLFIYFLVPELHRSSFQEAANRESNGSLFRLFFVPGRQILDGFRLVFRRFHSSLHTGIDRLILMFLVLLTICFVVSFGIGGIIFQYVTKHPISMPKSTYAIFHAVVSGLASANLLITLRVLRMKCSRFFALSDVALATIGVISRLIAYVFMGFADFYPQYMPWIYALLAMATGFFAASMRSLLSKLVTASERGSLFALVGVLESLSGLVASIVYNAIYATCISTEVSSSVPFLRGLVFFFSAGICLCPLLIFLWLLFSGETKHLPSSIPSQIVEDPHSVQNSLPPENSAGNTRETRQ